MVSSILLREKGKSGRLFEIYPVDFRVGIRRTTDGTAFITSFGLIRFVSYTLACLTNRVPDSVRLIDQQAEVHRDGEKISASGLVVVRPTGARADESFPFRPVPATLFCQTIPSSPKDKIENVEFNILITAIDAMNLLGLVEQAPVPTKYLIAGSILVAQVSGESGEPELLIRVGGSEPGVLSEEDRLGLRYILKRWLSGDQRTAGEERRRWFPVFNRNGIMFAGTERPRVRIHGISSPPLSYIEVAELYLLLGGLKGGAGKSENQPASQPGSSVSLKVSSDTEEARQ